MVPVFCLGAQNRLTSYQNRHILQWNMIIDSREACSFCQWYCSYPTVYISLNSVLTSSSSARGKECHFYSWLNSKTWIPANTLPTPIRMFLFTHFNSVHQQYLLIQIVTFSISIHIAPWTWKRADCVQYSTVSLLVGSQASLILIYFIL